MKSILIALALLMIAVPAMAAQVTLAWDANDPAPEGYRLFQRTETTAYDYEAPVWTGTVTTCTIDGLVPGVMYYFVVRAYQDLDESGDSNEVSFKGIIPAPTGLRVVEEIAILVMPDGTINVAMR